MTLYYPPGTTEACEEEDDFTTDSGTDTEPEQEELQDDAIHGVEWLQTQRGNYCSNEVVALKYSKSCNFR
jgi:hypothetical protein